MAATNMKLAGYWMVPETLDMTMFLSSIGCLRTSRVSLGNSVSSSKNRIPLWARETSHGVRLVQPQTIDILDAVWWTCLKGLCVIKGLSFDNFQITE